ncbi:MAG: energy transducer TonB, partial [Sphingobacteriales bacterium]
TCVLCSKAVTAQVAPPKPATEAQADIFTSVDEIPTFPGGSEALSRFLALNINYPDSALARNVRGKVILRFVINEAGDINDIRIVRDIGSGCGIEAMRVVAGMPRWSPGKIQGKAVKTYYTLPVQFDGMPEGSGEQAQDVDDVVFSMVDEEAEFPGGSKALQAYLATNLKYPDEARKDRTHGKVQMVFVVSRTGKIRDVKVKSGIGKGCDEEAIRLIKAMPAWKPAVVSKKPVSCHYSLTVNFKKNM